MSVNGKCGMRAAMLDEEACNPCLPSPWVFCGITCTCGGVKIAKIAIRNCSYLLFILLEGSDWLMIVFE